MMGIDGCKKGFMIALLKDLKLSFSHVVELSSIVDYEGLILVDVPLGCVNSIDQCRPEPCLRKHMKKKASSVFNAPALQCFEVSSYEDVNRVNREVLGKGISKQTFHIMPMIKTVNDFVLKYPHLNIHESFPEFVFMIMKGDVCVYSKHTKAGIDERVSILKSKLPEVGPQLDHALSAFPSAFHQDIVDASSLAICAYLIDKNGRRTIPHAFETNAQGIEMKVVFHNK